MTVKERAQRFAERSIDSSTPWTTEAMAELFEVALREELKDVAEILMAKADSKVKLYQDLGLNGDDQARPYRDVAEAVLRRSEL